jgi:beta-mannanase
MKRTTTIMLTALASLINANGAYAKTHNVQKAPPKIEHLTALPATVELGVYDLPRTFNKVNTIKYEELWFTWDNESEVILPKLKAIVAKGRTPLLTVEPLPAFPIGSVDTLLSDIATGKYKIVERSIGQSIKTLGSPVLVRFAPEMECVPIKPWSARNPADYIAAFQQFVSILREIAPTSLVVWSPIGEGSVPLAKLATLAHGQQTGMSESCEKYYPGDDFVDYVGCSIYELPVASISWTGHPQSFTDWMTKRYALLAQFNKPIIVTELGIAGTPEEQKTWLEEAFASLGNFPLVKALVYYNAKDANSWAQFNVEHPDWTIDPAVFTN